jgi:hypothetical protein
VSQFAASLFIGQSVGVAVAGIVAQTFDTYRAKVDKEIDDLKKSVDVARQKL